MKQQEQRSYASQFLQDARTLNKLQALDKPSVEAQREMEKRNRKVTALLDSFGTVFVQRLRRKERLKTIFFGISLTLLTLTVALIGGILWNLAQRPGEDIPAFITAMAGIVTALLGLPTIIAKYLFNKDEDQDITALFKNIASQDHSERHDLVSREAKGSEVQQKLETSRMQLMRITEEAGV